MVFWPQKYNPQRLDQLTFHPEVTQRLRELSKKKNIPHLVFYGKEGSGKRTRAYALLHEIFGDSATQLRVDRMKLDDKEEVTAYATRNSIEICASDLGRSDLKVVNNLIKTSLAQTSTLGGGMFADENTYAPRYRVVIIRDADSLTFAAQAGLRRTMEKYVNNCRVIFVVENLSALIPAVRSRVVCVRVPKPRMSDLEEHLMHIAKQEVPGHPPSMEYIRTLVEGSHSSITRALLTLELAATRQWGMSSESLQYLPWEMKVVEMVRCIVGDPSPPSVLRCREIAYELYSAAFDMNRVFTTLHNLILQHTVSKHPDLILGISRAALMCIEGIKTANNPVTHIEAFVAQNAFLIKDKVVNPTGVK